jgi:hypothetical protein
MVQLHQLRKFHIVEADSRKRRWIINILGVRSHLVGYVSASSSEMTWKMNQGGVSDVILPLANLRSSCAVSPERNLNYYGLPIQPQSNMASSGF